MKIGTHNGLHHPDDVIGCAILTKVFPGAEVIRTRDEKQLNKCDILVDVGGQYNGLTRFDHHQAGSPVRENGIPYSACGLVWEKFGHEFIKNQLGKDAEPELVDDVFKDIQDNFITYVDKVDNHLLSPDKNSVTEYIMMANDEGKMEAFNDGMDIALNYLKLNVKQTYKIALNNRYLKEKAVEARAEGLNYIVIDREANTDCLKEADGINFVIYPNQDKVSFMIRSLPYDDNPVVPIYPFDNNLRGLSTDELRKETGIEDINFIHLKVFCGGAKSVEGALSMIGLTAYEPDITNNHKV